MRFPLISQYYAIIYELKAACAGSKVQSQKICVICVRRVLASLDFCVGCPQKKTTPRTFGRDFWKTLRMPTLKQLAGEVSNTDNFIKVQCSAGKINDLALVWLLVWHTPITRTLLQTKHTPHPRHRIPQRSRGRAFAGQSCCGCTCRAHTVLGKWI